MSEEELKRMKDFINATLEPYKPNEYRLGYEDGIRKTYFLVDNLQNKIDKAIEYNQKIYDTTEGNTKLMAKINLEILGDKENE